MLNCIRRSLSAAVLLAACAIPVMAHADDKMGMMADDHSKMMMEQADKMKTMAADPQQAQQMSAEMAKMMVMDEMAKKMSMDPAVQKATADAMKDPNMMKVNHDAMMMAHDPEQMKKMEAEIMADPMAMKMVMHHSMNMVMIHDKMSGGLTDHGMKP